MPQGFRVGRESLRSALESSDMRPGRGKVTLAMANKRRKTSVQLVPAGHNVLLADVARVIEQARHAAARSIGAMGLEAGRLEG